MPIYLIIGRENWGDTLASSSDVSVSEPIEAETPEEAAREAGMAGYMTGEIYVLESSTPAATFQEMDL